MFLFELLFTALAFGSSWLWRTKSAAVDALAICISSLGVIHVLAILRLALVARLIRLRQTKRSFHTMRRVWAIGFDVRNRFRNESISIAIFLTLLYRFSSYQHSSLCSDFYFVSFMSLPLWAWKPSAVSLLTRQRNGHFLLG